MFYAYNWLNRSQLFSAFRSNLFKWLESNPQLAVYMAVDPDESPVAPEVRSLDGTEQKWLEVFLEEDYNNGGYGGCNTGRDLGDTNAYCHFAINDERTEARLTVLLAPEKLASLPLVKSPVLLLALNELVFDIATMQRVYLSSPEIDEEDRALLDMYGLVPDGEPGWWKKISRKEQEKPGEKPAEEIPAWLELSLQIEPGLLGVVMKLFALYGHKEHTLTARPIRTMPGGMRLPDEDSPLTLFTFIPVDESAGAKIARVREFLDTLRLVQPLEELKVTERTPKEWAAAWEGFSVFPAGQHFVVRKAGEPYISNPEDIVIEIDTPPNVFGLGMYGLHPTTELCLVLIEKYLEPVAHRKVLDVGAGAGILSIAAARLGVTRILALDAYLPAVETARGNAEINGVNDRVIVKPGSLGAIKQGSEPVYSFSEEALQPPPEIEEMRPFDAIFCNTFAHVLIGLAPKLFAALRPGGLLISSGIAARSADEVANALEKAGLKLLERREEHTWMALVHTR